MPSATASPTSCPADAPVPNDSMIVDIYRYDALGYPGPTGPVGWTPVAVGGRTAYLLETPETGTPAGLRVQWAIARPSGEEGAYLVAARLRGPNLDPLRAELAIVLGTATLASWATPAPSASDGLVHLALDGLSLDYPETWSFHLLPPVPGSTVWLTTFPAPATCCAGFVQPPDTIGLYVGEGSATPIDLSAFHPNTSVGGLPARLEEVALPGHPDVIALRWTVPVIEHGDVTLVDLGATIRSPGEATLRTAADAVIRSVRFDASVRPATASPTP
ncbi:MAG TPA: hypothetical protein VEY67_05555 [Candidatus Dormibacteraeota bacterium]|nr:hypothetical protein [Candidatus Dormibacteraeota bacterium]